MRGRLISAAVAVKEKPCANSFAIKMPLANVRGDSLQNEDSIFKLYSAYHFGKFYLFQQNQH